MKYGSSEIKIGALYCRVSTDELAEVQHGSLEQQKHMGIAMANQLTESTGIQHIVRHILVEEKGVSGGSYKRPKYQELLKLIEARKISFICAKEISRLCRSTSMFCALMQKANENGVSVHIKGLSIDFGSPMGKAMAQILAVVSELEREMIRERTRSSIRSAMLNNKKIPGGTVCIGFDPHPTQKGYWVPNSEELEKVKFLMKTFCETGSLKETLAEAVKMGIKTKRGNEMDYTYLKRLLTNKKLIGKMMVKTGRNYEEEVWVDLPHGTVVPEDLFQSVQNQFAKLDQKRGHYNRRGRRIYLLTGLLVNQANGNLFRGVSGISRNGDPYYYYWNDKGRVRLDAIEIENAIFKELKRAYQNDTQLATYIKQIEQSKFSRLDFLNSQITSTKNELREIQQEEEAVLRKLRQEIGSSTSSALSWLEKQIGQNESKRLDLEARTMELEKERDLLKSCDVNTSRTRGVLANVFERLMKADPAKQRGFLREIFEKIEVLDGDQIKLTWAIPAHLDSPPVTDGGEMVVLACDWRERWDSNPRPSP